MTAPELPDRREWTVDDLDNLPRDLRYELINGRLTLPSPLPTHQDVARRLANALDANCPPEYYVSTDQSLRVDKRNEPRPDVVAFQAEYMDQTPVPVEGVVLAIEVVSPNSEFRDMFDKAKVYAKAGIPRYWVVEQTREEISLTEMVLNRDVGRYDVGTFTTEAFSVSDPWEIAIDLPAMSARRAERRKWAESSGRDSNLPG
jgi:Uma2 family endonuclease